LTKGQLIKTLADKSELSKKQAGQVLDDLINIIVSSTKKGDRISISGFGIFELKHYKARQARNPQTGETINVPAKKKFRFKPAKALKDSIK
jgi:DNA-binding protein HU-beta